MPCVQARLLAPCLVPPTPLGLQPRPCRHRNAPSLGRRLPTSSVRSSPASHPANTKWTLAHAQRVPTPAGSPAAHPAPCRQTGDNLQPLLPAPQQAGSHCTVPVTPPGTPKSQVRPELTAQPDRSAHGRCTCQRACKGVQRQPAPCSAARPRGCPFPARPGPLRT